MMEYHAFIIFITTEPWSPITREDPTVKGILQTVKMALDRKQSSAENQRGQLKHNNLHWDEADPNSKAS